ncbi:hypothetical protein B5J99_19020 (plasmid) [Blastomonas fulva]|uniref:Uncharacterized protein n=1 Tax=Blastomonas fulva TaxID=1550728 RepID=A0ABM6MC98_9SPHN|nr:hypothetical protein B5J99_19020 [Blastomonas fulva]
MDFRLGVQLPFQAFDSRIFLRIEPHVDADGAVHRELSHQASCMIFLRFLISRQGIEKDVFEFYEAASFQA